MTTNLSSYIVNNLGCPQSITSPILDKEDLLNSMLCTSILPDEEGVIWLDTEGFKGTISSNNSLIKAEACLMYCFKDVGEITKTELKKLGDSNVRFELLKKVILDQTLGLDINFYDKESDNENVKVGKLDAKLQSMVSKALESYSNLKDFLFDRSIVLRVI